MVFSSILLSFRFIKSNPLITASSLLNSTVDSLLPFSNVMTGIFLFKPHSLRTASLKCKPLNTTILSGLLFLYSKSSQSINVMLDSIAFLDDKYLPCYLKILMFLGCFLWKVYKFFRHLNLCIEILSIY